MEKRTVRVRDVKAGDTAHLRNGIEDLYEDRVDVIVIRGAFPRAPLAEAGASLDRDDIAQGWNRPNAKMPIEDIQILGTDTPATPTYSAPRGASLEAYLESAKKHSAETKGVFTSGFDATAEFQRVLAGCASGKPVDVAATEQGQAYVPYTIRRLTDGRQIGAHHDYHYGLSLYTELAPRLDTNTLVSFVVTLGTPDAGGELFVYGVTPQTPAPKLPNGFSWDVPAIEKEYPFERLVMDVGDVFLLASGRCLHRVGPIQGRHARVTMGGFLAFDKPRTRVLFWS